MMRARSNGIDGAAACTNQATVWSGEADRIASRTSHRPSGTNRTAGTAALAALLLAGGLLILAAGCQEDAGVMRPNRPPVTYLSVLSSGIDSSGSPTDLDTLGLGYQQILRWWGSDPDGRVEAYLIRWNGGWTPPDGARHWTDENGDSSWVVTTATTDTFALATYGTADPTWVDPDVLPSPMYRRHTFSVRALDNDGAVDPVGKTQKFKVTNNPPMLRWSNSIARPDSAIDVIGSLPAVAFAWHPIDRDGHETVRSFAYWLKREGQAHCDTFRTADTLVGLVPTAFDPDGITPQPGRWTLHVQAIDDSRTRSVPISWTWTVGLPAGKYLLIDNAGVNCPGNGPGDGPFDGIEDKFFRSMMDEVAPGNYHIMDIEAEGQRGFRTGVEVGPFLSLFKGVLWYSGMQNAANDALLARNLSLADRSNGLRDYLFRGGRLVLCAHNAVGDSAALSRAFQLNVLGIADWYRRRDRTSLTPEYINGNIMLSGNSVIHTLTGGQPESLLVKGDLNNADFLIPALDPYVTPLFTVAPGFLNGANPPSEGWEFTPNAQTTDPAALGVLSERFGRMGVMSIVPSRTQGYFPEDRPHSRVIMAEMLRRILAVD